MGRWKGLSLLVFGLVAWGGGQDVAAGEPELIFAKVSSDGSPDQVAVRYGPLLQAMSQAIGRTVVFHTRGTYEEMAAAMARQSFDIVSAGPSLYLDHEAIYEPVARPIRFKRDSYRGIILVRQDSPIKALKDLKGHKLGFVSPKSTSGYLLPLLLIERSGLNPERDFAGRIAFYQGNHTEVARAVTNGDVDAGACYDDARIDAYGEDRAARSKTRVLAATPTVPNDPVMVRKSLPAALKQRIARFFTTAGTSTQAAAVLKPIDEGVSGWVPTKAADYDPVRAYRTALRKAEQSAK